MRKILRAIDRVLELHAATPHELLKGFDARKLKDKHKATFEAITAQLKPHGLEPELWGNSFQGWAKNHSRGPFRRESVNAGANQGYISVSLRNGGLVDYVQYRPSMYSSIHNVRHGPRIVIYTEEGHRRPQVVRIPSSLANALRRQGYKVEEKSEDPSIEQHPHGGATLHSGFQKLDIKKDGKPVAEVDVATALGQLRMNSELEHAAKIAKIVFSGKHSPAKELTTAK